ncbi:cupredoxin domain-containing protein [Iamia majanohamensis]|uniref:Cupredoxin domain-containing protein n=1 Tax=Iamia majanohamensis TaxID=467976 RepID=A0AAF0BWP1_9ACTN|nr:cupredoxin domain-containing protein [Iamia majanohamensis]WCO68288.1 cupredoxin domain-containing protein [Iamia majanohamensis]
MTRPRHRPLLVAVATLVAAGLLGACGGDEEASGPPPDCTRIEDGAVTLVAENLQWDADCLRVPQGTEVTFTVDNRDQGVQHNLDVAGPSGEEGTELEAGPVTQTLVYDATEAGRHPYVCEIHPAMEGDLWVTPAAG